MSKLSERIKNSSIVLESVSKSISSTNKSLASTRNSVDNISKVISNNTKVKNELFQRSSIIEARRREASKRQEREDQLEALRVSTVKAKGLSFASKTSGGIFNRLLSFLGYVTAGWLVENLPTWIFAGKELIFRIQTLGESIYDMTSNLYGILSIFGDILGSSLNSILRLDFDEFSGENFKKSFDELSLSMGNLGQQIIDIFKTPLTESLQTGERARGLGEMSERSLYDGTGGGANQTRASVGTREQRAMLDTIAWAEGGRTYRTMFGGGQFDVSKGWKHPDTVVRTPGYASAAAGRYQYMPNTWNMVSTKLGLQDFSPINQDKGAIWLMDYRLGGNSADILRREGVSDRVLNAFAQEWAAIPTASGGSYYGQPVKTPKQIRDKYAAFLGTVSEQPRQQSQPTSVPLSPITGTSGPSMGNRPLSVPYSPFAGTAGGPVLSSGMGMRGNRDHTGYDISAEPGTPLYAYFPGKVTHANHTDEYGAGYGYWVIWKDDVYGAYHFFGHMQKPPSVRVGDAVNQGTLMGLVGSTGKSTGPHLHWEISTQPPRSNGQFTSYEDLGQWLRNHPIKDSNTNTRTSAAQATPAPAQATPAPAPAQAFMLPNTPTPTLIEPQISTTTNQMQQMQITPERRGQNIIIADNRQSPQVPQYIPSGFGGSQYSSNAGPNEFELLNNFIKNKLLLDLVYL